MDRFTGLLSLDEASGVAWFGAGTTIGAVFRLLEPLGWDLVNVGDIDRQTLAGAVSTGTHGTGMAFAGLPAMVVDLRLVLADGAVVHSCATERPGLFEAARVGLGAFGVITAVAVRCVPAFLVRADEHAESLRNVLVDFPARMAAADHVEFYWFPHSDVALVKANTRLPLAAPVGGLPRWRRILEDDVVNNGVFGAACWAGFAVPSIIPSVNRLASNLVAVRRYSGRPHQVFTSPRRVRFREMEYALDVDSVPEAIREIDQLIKRRGWRISFPLEVRVAAADDVWLSMAYGRRTGYVAVHRFYREPFAEYFLAVEQILLGAGGRPHWGKLHTCSAVELRRIYPRFDDAAAVRASVDPEGQFLNPWLARLLFLNSDR